MEFIVFFKRRSYSDSAIFEGRRWVMAKSRPEAIHKAFPGRQSMGIASPFDIFVMSRVEFDWMLEQEPAVA